MILGFNLTKSSETPLYKGEAGGEVWVRHLTYTSPEPHLYLTRNLTRSIVWTDCAEVRLVVRYEWGISEVKTTYLTCGIAFIYWYFERFSEVSAKNEEILQISGWDDGSGYEYYTRKVKTLYP